MKTSTQADSNAPAPVAHTAEPWFLGDGGFMVLADSSNAIALGCDLHGSAVASANVHTTERITPAQRRANLARIVACVNACRGITTEELEEEHDAAEVKIVTKRFLAEAQAQDLRQKLEIARLRASEFNLRSVLRALELAATAFDGPDRAAALMRSTSAARRLLEQED